ncbi:Glycosyltransferase involved in cell wall bisynthesis [Cribrihabitans marinus]|uniref:Glycosyltransferase involved in cell wall bisynthesis n=2 Tax=Cribrihabitans marinus TaxID=1227549 RepID=A0A1H7DQY4_9RHOB|nr:peptidase M14 [Cribrihabitans marinus]SEK04169.1 Glycosyltransferase involved in cell wall bisynthesis [Cribrihabitans marinus]
MVRFFPDYRDFNPYQDLLYGSLGPSVVATPIPDPDRLVTGAGAGDAGSILHMHWESAAFVEGDVSAERLLDALSSYRDRGGRIVWTLHNLTPHDERHRAAAEQVRTGLLDLADIVHVHSLAALAAAMEQHAVPMRKVRIIPHGNYDGVYPVFERGAARKALGLDAAGMVALLPGQIRAYKSPAELVAAFLQVAGDDDRLILAGHRASDIEGWEVPDEPRLVARFGFATHEDLARVHAASDLVVLPYMRSLTSGSAILAQTLGRGILGRDTPGLRDAVSEPATGLLYDPRQPGALAHALREALAEGPDAWAVRGAVAAKAARARDWTAIGAAWRSLFTELASLPRPARVLAR